MLVFPGEYFTYIFAESRWRKRELSCKVNIDVIVISLRAFTLSTRYRVKTITTIKLLLTRGDKKERRTQRCGKKTEVANRDSHLYNIFNHHSRIKCSQNEARNDKIDICQIRLQNETNAIIEHKF